MFGIVNDSIDKSSIMDRGEREERIVDIYITAEAVRDIKHNKVMEECNATTTQPAHTGSEMKRRYRSVMVCLVVLCVLLLTAVIVLCVLIYTNNHQFHIKNKNLTEERDQLLTNYTNLTRERDELKAKYNNITDLNEQINREKNELLKYLHDGWIYYKSGFYYISYEKKSWNDSRRYCRDNGADLIIINNTEKQNFVEKISDQETVWIGLSDSEKEGMWKWVDDSTPTTEFWRSGEPNSNAGNEDCAVSYTSRWADWPCDVTFKWICEKKHFQMRFVNTRTFTSF